jgi:hypothetical protein
MKRATLFLAGVLFLGVIGVGLAQQFSNLKALLSGFGEVPGVSTVAGGQFSATIDHGDESIDWQLTYADTEADVTQAHIHFGRDRTNGGISVWLCSNLASPPTPPGVQACPLRAGTISGTIASSDVVGPAVQGISAGELDELILAIRAGETYANVHTTLFPAGEIRDQIGPHKGRH